MTNKFDKIKFIKKFTTCRSSSPAAAGTASMDVCNKEGDMMAPEHGSNMSEEQITEKDWLVERGMSTQPASGEM